MCRISWLRNSSQSSSPKTKILYTYNCCRRERAKAFSLLSFLYGMLSLLGECARSKIYEETRKNLFIVRGKSLYRLEKFSLSNFEKAFLYFFHQTKVFSCLQKFLFIGAFSLCLRCHKFVPCPINKSFPLLGCGCR